MKPIYLKIKGLNSFIETAEIDFNKLIDKNLFGIFGPTGSGKSTILDGITLALYGEVTRKSSNFMNTNCDSLNVSFEFQISGREIKKYRVDREFRRDSKTGNVRSKSAKIVNITEGLEEILEDGPKTVTEKCEEIIGLKIEDFTRTVVLPQGKFSEFLKLEGKDRRNMLERLFNLQKYGDDLSIKLGNRIRGQREKVNILEGQLKGYENINDEILKEKRNILSETKEAAHKCKEELNIAEECFNKGRELWEIQNELKELKISETKLKENEKEIKENSKKAMLGESYLKVKPYIDSYENTIGQIFNISKELEELNASIELIKKDKQNKDDELKRATEKKNIDLPILKVKEQKVIFAIDEEITLNILLKEKETLLNEIENLKVKLISINNKLEKSNNSIAHMTSSITLKEEKIETLKISEDYKKSVNEAILILNDEENLLKQQNKLISNKKNILSIIEEAQGKSIGLKKSISEKEDNLFHTEDTLKELIKACPGDQNTLLSHQERLSFGRDRWSKFEEYNKVIIKCSENLTVLKRLLDEKLLISKTLEMKIAENKDNISRAQMENLAHTLREGLKEGEPCPVCGSKEHYITDVTAIDARNLEELKLDLTNKEENNKHLLEEIVKYQTNIKTEEFQKEENQKKIELLGEEFKSISVKDLQEEFNKLKEDINKYNAEKDNLDNKIKGLIEEKNSLEIIYNKDITIVAQNQSQLFKLEDDLKLISEELEKTNKKIMILKEQLGIFDFKEKRDEILNKEKEKASLEMEVKKLRENLDLEQKQRELFNKELGTLREKLSEINSSILEKTKSIEEKEKGIKNKVGDRKDLHKLKDEITVSITTIESAFEKAEKEKDKIEKQYTQCNENLIALHRELFSLKERSLKDKESMQKALMDEGFKDINEAKENLMLREEIIKLKGEIEEYNNALAKISGTIENLKRKIGDKALREEQWIEIQNEKSEKTAALKVLEETKIKLETEVKDINEKLNEMKKLLKEKDELNHVLGLLDDLEKLFKGKKFVEFVALNQLKYISIEASKRLKDITSGNYGLEVDENGKFLIRDYKNGGAERDASTLSGGETFVASLALALALSAQIQLKGTAPLELFFLDEGFGTLDDNLLEIVMDSLEKIHNNRLSIGIISHLESIKNRMPVKLIVTPAVAGMGGSKVEIERS